MNRDQSLDTLKGIGIILMVVGHSGAPLWIHDSIYSFHMPLFFIASGYFFSESSLDNKRLFTLKKINGLYIPYLLWSIIFLLLHNVFFSIGLLNDSYGYEGSVEKWYHSRDFVSHFLNITFRMIGYDNLIGTFWFLRSLLFGSLLLCFSSWLLLSIIRRSKVFSILSITIFYCIIGGVISYLSIKIPWIPQGGYREVMATFFIGVGYVMKKSDRWRSPVALALSLIVLVVCIIFHPTSMKVGASFMDWLVILITGNAGFIVTYHVSKYIVSHGMWLRDKLVYIGKRTFYIMTFHFFCFKPVSLLKAYIYDLDWQVIGYHPVIPPMDDYWFWIIYTVAALVLSLLLEKVAIRIPTPVLKINNHN